MLGGSRDLVIYFLPLKLMKFCMDIISFEVSVFYYALRSILYPKFRQRISSRLEADRSCIGGRTDDI